MHTGQQRNRKRPASGENRKASCRQSKETGVIPKENQNIAQNGPQICGASKNNTTNFCQLPLCPLPLHSHWKKWVGPMSQRIRIKLQSYDHSLVDKSAEKIVKTVRSTGAVVTGPIPLPTRKKIFTVLRSPHVNKKSREQFQLATHKRLLDIYTSSSRTVDALSKLDLPSGVEVEIKA